jgi:2-iminobutanoate/2-iminopropanoate deaminase
MMAFHPPGRANADLGDINISSSVHIPPIATTIRTTRFVVMNAPAQPVGPYTPVVRAGDWVIVSGQLGLDNGALVPGGVAAQTAQAVKNLQARLKEMGLTLKDVAKTLCFLTDMDTFATFNAAYVHGFGDARPARSTIGVAALPFAGAVEIEAWAYKPVAKPAAKKVAAKKTAKKAGTKVAAKKVTAKKVTAKKAPAKKVAAKKVTKKAVAKKAPARKPAKKR